MKSHNVTVHEGRLTMKRITIYRGELENGKQFVVLATTLQGFIRAYQRVTEATPWEPVAPEIFAHTQEKVVAKTF